MKKQVEIVRDEEEVPQPQERRSWWSGRRQAHSVLESLSSHGSSVGGGGQDKDEPLLGASASSDSLELSDGDDDTLLRLDQADGVSCPCVVELPISCCFVVELPIRWCCVVELPISCVVELPIRCCCVVELPISCSSVAELPFCCRVGSSVALVL